MKNNFRLSRLFVLLAVAISIVSCGGTELKDRPVVILSMDGFRWDYCDNAHTPTLDSLRKVGTYAQTMPVFPANTFPNHYSMATGLHPNNHGVTNNSFYNRELGRTLSVFDKEDTVLEGFWGGEPIWNGLERQGGVAHIYMWPGSEYVIGGHQATVWTPYDHHMDYFAKVDKVMESLRTEGDSAPDLIMWYMPDPDEVGHKFGPDSKERIARVEYIDSVLCDFFARARELPNFEDINFILTSDHGMTALSNERYVNLYSLFDRSKVKEVIKGSPLYFEVEDEYVDEALEILNSQEHLSAYRREQIPAEFHYGSNVERITNIVALPDMGWRYDYSSKDSDVGSTGAHGYNPFGDDMKMVFYGVGPDFKSGYEHTKFQDLNVYLVLCHLLKIEPATNDGDWNSVKSMFVE